MNSKGGVFKLNWREFAKRQPFLTDLGEESSAAAGGPGRYAVWSPMSSGDGNCIVDVSDDLGALLEKYRLSSDRLCILDC